MTRVACSCCRKRLGDRRRMMCEVVDDCDSSSFPANLQSAFDALEVCQCLRNPRSIEPQRLACRDHPEAVSNIEQPGKRSLVTAEFQPVSVYLERRRLFRE